MAQRHAHLELAKQNILEAQHRQMEAFDRKHACPLTYKVGARVLKKDFTRKRRRGGKLDCKWVGPYRIAAHLGKGLFRLEREDNPMDVITRVNGLHLKAYLQPQEVHVHVQCKDNYMPVYTCTC